MRICAQIIVTIAAIAGLLTGPACAGPKLKIKKYTFEAASGDKVAAELGTLRVPENRSREDSRTIKLKFVRFPSTAKEPGPPIVYLAGGPGGSGIGAARGSRFPLFLALREFGDVIALDQRGTGMTGFEDLDCDDRYTVPFDKPMDRAEAAAIIAKVTKDCIDRKRRSGIDVSAYNTRESAADLNDLRVALGAEKIRLWGISYGTHLALATVKYHGEIVDRVILAGLEGLHHSWKLPQDQQELIEEISRLAAQDPSVREAVPDLLESLEKLMATLDERPQTVTLANPRDGEPMDVTVGKFDLQVALSNLLRGPEYLAVLPDVVSRLEQDDWVELALAATRERTGEGLHSMSVAMDCASGASRAWLSRIEQEAKPTLIGDAINFPYPEICRELEIPDLGDEFRAPVVSELPALLISGTLDGRTPVSNGTELMEHLSGAQHLIIDGAGHSDPLFLSSPRILEAMQAFLRGEKIPFERIELPPMRFVPPGPVVELGKDQLSKYVGTYRINGDDVRKVMLAGDVLFTHRRGPALPIRPRSKSEFFYVGSLTRLEFQFDGEGNVTGMLVYHDGSDEAEPAEKYE